MLTNRLSDSLTANCDSCGVDLETCTPDFRAAVSILKEAGWRIQKGADDNWEHRCPECA